MIYWAFGGLDRVIVIWVSMFTTTSIVVYLSFYMWSSDRHTMPCKYIIKILTLSCFFWLILGQRKTSLWKRRTISVVFLANNFSNGLYKTIRNNIVAKKTTELVLLFHKKTTKLVFLWPNIDQKCFKVLSVKDKIDKILYDIEQGLISVSNYIFINTLKDN